MTGPSTQFGRLPTSDLLATEQCTGTGFGRDCPSGTRFRIITSITQLPTSSPFGRQR